MATREGIVAGLEITVTEAKRATSLFAEGEWESERGCGWTPKEVYSHPTSAAAIVPSLAQGLIDDSEGEDIGKGMDMNEMNPQTVAAMASMTQEQAMATFQANYQRLMDFVTSLTGDQLSAKRRLLSDTVPASDILANAVLLHGLHHV